jgi:C_GCAxxG_C_C family probable redox protein
MKQIMSARIEQAVLLFKQGFNCSQSIVATYGEQFGLSREQCLKLGSGFGGGMGAMAETCGAVTGAFMVLGLKYGSDRTYGNEAKLNTYKLIREFTKKFKDRNGSILCKDVLDCDISTAEGYQAAKEKELFSTVCPKIVQDAAEILEEMLME